MLHKYSEVALGLCIYVDLVEFCGFFSLEKTAFDSIGRARKGQKHLLSVIVKVLKCLYLHRFLQGFFYCANTWHSLLLNHGVTLCKRFKRNGVPTLSLYLLKPSELFSFSMLAIATVNV